MSSSSRYVFYFGGHKADGDSKMKNLLGGKGANLCEMVNMGIPVPPGFVISTEVCAIYNQKKGKYPQEVLDQIDKALRKTEKEMGKLFGDPTNPLLFSVRSGAAVSMPGMMDTVLNLGMNDATAKSLIKNRPDSARFVFDSYRRFIAMYSNVVMQLNMEPFEHELWNTKKRLNVNSDSQIPAEELKRIVGVYQALYAKATGNPFPQNPMEQLFASINAVFRSWENPRAVRYRTLYNIKGLIGTAVNVQGMVFGNRDDQSATGVCFSRDPGNGDPGFYGEYLINAQGEDVVAGIRTPQQIRKAVSVKWGKDHGVDEARRSREFPSMEEAMPDLYQQLVDVKEKLEKHFKDMQDIEFTIESGRLWLLQTRNGKRTTTAAVKIAVDMVREGMIDEKEAIMRIDPSSIDQLLHPMINPKHTAKYVAKGLPASPGAGVGQIVFTANDAEAWHKAGKKVIMVRVETSPEDLGGMTAAEGILTARGGMTSHAAVVARGMGKTCVAGCSEIVIDAKAKTVTVGDKVYKEGDWLSIDGTAGKVFEGKAELITPDLSQGDFATLLDWARKFKRLGVRANADIPRDALQAVKFGAEGVGLCRTEHMFFEGDRIDAMREMILATENTGRNVALQKILPHQRSDFIGIFKAMAGRPCTIRLLDPPLHEFVPHDEKTQRELATKIGHSFEKVRDRVKELHEQNPMLGHRGVRLGLSYPEIYNIQVQAIMEAAVEVKRSGMNVHPEIMIPLVGKREELTISSTNCVRVAETVLDKNPDVKITYHIGTMIEVPRACVTADEIAKDAEFFSFGTNDLTQMGCGFSRDDSAGFLEKYKELGIYERDPFQSIDTEGVGALIRIAVQKGRETRPNIKLGICGEHGGDPASIEFCHHMGLTYVSCSPFRVPIAIVAAARAAIKEERVIADKRKKILQASKL